MDGSVYCSPVPEFEIPEGLDWEIVEFKRINDGFGARMVRIVNWNSEEKFDPIPSSTPPAFEGQSVVSPTGE